MMSKTEISGDDAAEEWSTRLTGKKTLPSRQNGKEQENRPNFPKKGFL